MSRLISFALTEESFLDGTKTATRRLGWWEDKRGRRLVIPGDRLTGCRKVMGRTKGEPLVRLGEILVTDVYRQQLFDMTSADVDREGVPLENFGGYVPHPSEWVEWFCAEQKCQPWDFVTVIEFYRVPPLGLNGEASCEDWCMVQCQRPCGGFIA